MIRAILALCLWVAAPALPAGAEIFKCVGPDGKTVFTSRADACPGATPHRSRGQVQSVPTSQRPSRAPARRGPPARRATGQSEEAQAATWKAKRTAAEQERKRVAHNVEAYRRVVTGCNRGSNWWRQDETGLKQEFTCDEARATHEKLERRLAELDDYLSSGLAEECRRAGCLPGWIR